MKKLTSYELEVLERIKKNKEMSFFDRALLSLLKRYSFKIYQRGFKSRYFK